MKILVAGGAGFIGSVVVPKLADRGYEVDVIDWCWFGNHLPKNIKLIKKNIFDITEAELKEYDQVIFLGGVSNDPMAEFSPKDNFIYNSALPAYLCFMAKKANVKRFIYAGSCSVYGYTVDELYDEESPTVSAYPYGISKLQGELSVMQMKDENHSVICFRQGTVCGYSPRMRLDLVINTMFKNALSLGQITLNNPAIWRPVVSLHDLSDAYIRAVEASDEISGVFNISSANYTLGQLGDIVKERIEAQTGKAIKMQINHNKDFRNYKVSCDKAAKVLGYVPKDDAGAIVDNLFANYEKFKDFENPEYYNIQIFKSIKEQMTV
ncbi:MAG: SDR family oxidoreductase [Bacteroidota bacterium]